MHVFRYISPGIFLPGERFFRDNSITLLYKGSDSPTVTVASVVTIVANSHLATLRDLEHPRVAAAVYSRNLCCNNNTKVEINQFLL